MATLISNTEFVLQQFELLYDEKITQDVYIKRIVKYSEFLKTKLTIEMFVSCDEKGNPLKQPNNDNCIFEGFVYAYDSIFLKAKLSIRLYSFKHNNTVESLVSSRNPLKLTEYAKKQLDL
jgi:hypothetical protein